MLNNNNNNNKYKYKCLYNDNDNDNNNNQKYVKLTFFVEVLPIYHIHQIKFFQ